MRRIVSAVRTRERYRDKMYSSSVLARPGQATYYTIMSVCHDLPIDQKRRRHDANGYTTSHNSAAQQQHSAFMFVSPRPAS